MKNIIYLLLVVLGALNSAQALVHAQSAAFAAPAFQRLWERTDAAVAAGRAQRSWLWGSQPITGGIREAYAQSANGTRLVQYFDKARMEINDPAVDPNALWYVTNGLLPIELITGRVQTGNEQFEQRQPAVIAAVGDPDNVFPTYANLARVFARSGAGDIVGSPVTGSLNPDGAISGFDAYRSDAATRVALVEQQHGIPAAFLDYMNAQSGQLGRLFVFGQPVSGAYWVRAKVGRVEQPVMFQVYERRVLTYTPNNPAPFRTESGNVGQHYLQWRYPAPTVEVAPTQAPAGTTFTVRVSGLAAGETATVNVTPAPLDPTKTYTITGNGGPVALPIQTNAQSAQGTWPVTVVRSVISPTLTSVARFTVSAP